MIEIGRLAGWINAYHAVIEDIRAKPFSWDEHDCMIGFASRVVHAITGEDLTREIVGQYHDAAGAYETMRRAGFTDVADAAASVLPEYGHPSEAQIGDIAALPSDTVFRSILGVFNGERIFVLGETCLGTVDRRQATRAFRVGQ